MANGVEISYISGINSPRIGCGCQRPAVGFFASAPDATNPDSIPNTSVIDSTWDCSQWITWHKANVSAYGQSAANDKFQQYWSQLSTWDSAYNFCKYQSDFYNYFKSQGIDTGWWLSHLFVDASQIVNNTGSAAVNLSNAATNTTKVIQWLLPISVIALVGIGALNLKKSYANYSTSSPRLSVNGYKKAHKKEKRK
jgi:hypothetical protein